MAQNYSFRIPWHDNGWNGTVCIDPKENYACMRLKGINQGRNQDLETECSKCRLCELEERQDIPCIREGVAIMSENAIELSVTHPFSGWSEYHKHLLPTKEIIPAYSYPARPYRWLMRERNIGNKEIDRIDDWAIEKGVDFHSEYEPQMNKKTWVQDGRNQKAVFDAFLSDAKPNESLCVFYAKQVPFVEDVRRVVIGIGHIKGVEPPIKFNMSGNGMTSYSWENMVKHSIRPDMRNGFLIPYNELMKYAEEHDSFDISKATVFAADDYFEEFSYAAEQLSHDAVIDVILQCVKSLEIVKQCKIKGDWDHCIKWLNDQFVAVWEDRGAFPGFGSMLTTIGIPSGPVVAKELKNRCNSDTDDIWSIFEKSLDHPGKYLSSACAAQITNTVCSTWRSLPRSRKVLFKLLSRLFLSSDQAKILFLVEQRENNGIFISDDDILNNPYLIYEQTRSKADKYKISIKKVDLAFYPPQFIADNFPIPAPSAMSSDIDERRVRALAIDALERASLIGNTLLPLNNIVYDIAGMDINPKCPITSDMLSGMSDFLTSEIEVKKDLLGKDYYKLCRYKKIDSLIASQVKKRIQSPNRHKIDVDWRAKVNEVCDLFASNPDAEIEENARAEKAAALKTLAESRLSVLVGGAGTGKTTVLEILCKEPEIQDEGILLLAPTGKARVRMSQGLRGKANFKAQTIAQFLLRSKRYDWDTCTYKILSAAERQKVKTTAPAKTVIIDESSMITEDMFGAIMDAISSTAERIIFIGDYNQLPPIGAGRPFVDLVHYIQSVDEIGIFPNVGKCYAKLTITNRQLPDATTSKVRSDVRLARWFTDENTNLDEEVFTEMQSGRTDGRLVFCQWHSKEELDELLCEQISTVADMNDKNDIDGFSRSLGGIPHYNGYKGFTAYHPSSAHEDGCAKCAENWQIIAPVRNDTHGVLHINHMIHDTYRCESIELANNDRYKKLAKRMGAGGIVYGDKVINVVNKQRDGKNLVSKHFDNYVANGEIGMVCGEGNRNNELFHVEFSSQLGSLYEYLGKRDFSDDGDTLELAYALTVHKSQGSQFTAVIVVLSDKCALLSKEMLYTALTRQKDRLIILYDDEAYNLKKFSSMENSEIARRYTDLFESPKIVEVNNRFYEEKLIHTTKNGIMVRSKSEVIIANMLYDNGFEDYLYEERLPLGGTFKCPDFTIKDAATGRYVIWEHLGLLGNEEYRKSWEAKRKLYEAYGFSEENGNLIVTRDALDGAINSQEIQEKIDAYLR